MRDRRRAAARGARLLAVLATASPFAAKLASAAPQDPLCSAEPLRILLTNDDGYTATGIRALRARLVAAGHRVVLVAPDRNMSGSSLSLQWGTVHAVPDPADPNVIAVSGSPATAVAFGASQAFIGGARPDLVISGINHGPNVGTLLALSGTIGGALAGTLFLNPPVPGIAVNSARLNPTEPFDSPANRAHLDDSAAHLVRLLSAVRPWFCDDGQVVRRTTVLNVNYPGLPLAKLRGVVVARPETRPSMAVSVTPSGANEFKLVPKERGGGQSQEGSDEDWLARGYVTVTPLSAGLTDEDVPRAPLVRSLRGL